MKKRIQIYFLSFATLLFIDCRGFAQPAVTQTTIRQMIPPGQPFRRHEVKPPSNKQTKDRKKGRTKMEKEIKREKAIFGAGCFWGVEEILRKTPGVLATTVGYSGGTVPEPSYERVCMGDTKHAEVVEIEYDPKKITYDDLLKIFFANHNPTTLNRQGPDIGYQYRSVIFYTSAEQEEKAKAAKAEWEKTTAKTAVTAIEPAAPFYKAEEYHQHYLEKRGLNVCH